MYYEDKLNQAKIRDNIRTLIHDFYEKESKSKLATKQTHLQIEAISSFNLMTLSYIDRNKHPNVIDAQFREVAKDLDAIFKQANDQDLFIIRLEGFIVRMVLMFGKEVIDEMEEDFVDYLCSITPRRKYYENPFEETPVSRKGEIHYRKRLVELCKIYQFLWTIPYFTELFSVYKTLS